MKIAFQGLGEGRETTPFRVRASAKLWMENVELAGCKTVRGLLLMLMLIFNHYVVAVLNFSGHC